MGPEELFVDLTSFLLETTCSGLNPAILDPTPRAILAACRLLQHRQI
jgi:hypothetical protein